MSERERKLERVRVSDATTRVCSLAGYLVRERMTVAT